MHQHVPHLVLKQLYRISHILYSSKRKKKRNSEVKKKDDHQHQSNLNCPYNFMHTAPCNNLPLIPLPSWRSLLSSTDSCRNPGNSQNSGGIKFGRGACQIDQLIQVEFQMEFKFRRNGSRNYPEGMPPGMRRNGILAESLFVDNVQIEHRCLLMLNLGIINKEPYSLSQPPPSSTTPTHLTHHCHQWPAPTTTHNSQTPPTMSMACPNTAMPRHQPQLINKCLERTTVPRRCQQHGKQQTTTSVVICCLCPR